MTEDDDIVMQWRCLHCLREQWGPAVYGVSRGEGGCAWCGQLSRPMSAPEYRTALVAARTAQQDS